jgi:hypothetical protein
VAKFIVRAEVWVPARGSLEVEAETEEEAIAKVMARAEKADPASDDEWASKIWVNGGWKPVWEEAERFDIFDTEERPDGVLQKSGN